MISLYMAGRADSNMISDALAGAAFASQTLGAIYGIFGMWRPLLTYGLLTLTITGLTLFNMMT
jgi:hypothetical protein